VKTVLSDKHAKTKMRKYLLLHRKNAETLIASRFQKRLLKRDIPLFVWVQGPVINWTHYSYGDDLTKTEESFLELVFKIEAARANLRAVCHRFTAQIGPHPDRKLDQIFGPDGDFPLSSIAQVTEKHSERVQKATILAPTKTGVVEYVKHRHYEDGAYVSYSWRSERTWEKAGPHR